MARNIAGKVVRGEARFYRWLAAHPDASPGRDAALRWLREDLGLAVISLGPARYGVAGDYCEDWYGTPDWLAGLLIADGERFWAPARPAIGTRVRLRISPECRQPWGPPGAEPRPHDYAGVLDGMTGTVVRGWPGFDPTVPSHDIAVEFDETIRDGDFVFWGGWYASFELEPEAELGGRA